MEPLTMQQSPVEKTRYDYLDPNIDPRYGVTCSMSENFQTASRYVFAWFTDKHDAYEYVKYQTKRNLIFVWDLDLGVKVL
jgi:hypothetical protein